MNYKEAATKLNEFNDFMVHLKVTTICKIGNNVLLHLKNFNVSEIPIINFKIKYINYLIGKLKQDYLSKEIISIEPAGPVLKNDRLPVKLSNEESIFNERPNVKGMHATTVIYDESNLLNSERIGKLINCKPLNEKPTEPYILHDTGAFYKPVLPNNKHLQELLNHIKNKTK
jgi:hypothetical protein